MGVKGAVAVIGAGLAGLTCARTLRDAGHRVELFERDDTLGGRLRTERTDGVRYDLGAQYVTARTREFKRMLDGLALAGNVAGWKPRLLVGGAENLVGEIAPQDWYVGVPGMGSMVRPLAEDLRVHLSSRVVAMVRSDERWFLDIWGQDEPVGPFHAVLVTVTAPEAYPLLCEHDDLFDELTRVRMLPCWSVMIQFGESVGLTFDVGSRLSDSIAWIARDSSKPNRRRRQENWVLHASPDFSREFLEEDPAEVGQELWREAQGVLKLEDAEPALIAASCWRYALVERTLGASCTFSRDQMLGAAGDWCLGSRAEAAHESALALARRVNDAFAMM